MSTNPTAAELDTALVAKKAYTDARAAGQGDAQAQHTARVAIEEHHRKQTLRGLGAEA